VTLCRGQRSCGLLQQICDQLRNGKQKYEDRRVLMRQKINFPEFIPDFTVHYDNESCSSTNWRQLWSQCMSQCQSTDLPSRMYICRALYHTKAENHQDVDGLPAFPVPK